MAFCNVDGSKYPTHFTNPLLTTMERPISLSVNDIGSGTPILFIHGWETSGIVEARDFEPIFINKPGYRRIYIDLPGMGQSPAKNVHNLDDMLEAVCDYIESSILPSNFLLVGSSCGAYLARAVAYRYARNVDGLFLRVPVIQPDSPKRDVDSVEPSIRNDALISQLSQSELDSFGDIPIQTPGYISTLREKIVHTYIPAEEVAQSSILDPIRNDPERYRLNAAMHTPESAFEGPTLIVTGRQDSAVGHRDALSILPCYSRASFVVLDRGTHALPVDEIDKEIFGVLVEDWFRRVEEHKRFQS